MIAHMHTHLVQKSFDNILEAGPFVRPGLGGGAGLGGASLVEEEWVSCREDDLHSLLVKAWEAKVFPVIQRRFRNDQEAAPYSKLVIVWRHAKCNHSVGSKTLGPAALVL